MMTRTWTFLAALAIAGCTSAHPSEPAPTTSGETWLTAEQLREAKVEIAEVGEHTIGTLVTTSGRVTFDDLHVAHVFSPVTGRITKISAELGQRVKKGQALAVIDSPDLGMASADLAKAYADVVAAQHDYDRQKALLAIKAVAEKDVEASEDNYRKAKAELGRAQQKARLFRVGGGSGEAISQGYVLTSLIDGEVVSRTVNPGMEVQGQYAGGTSNELFTVGEIDPLWVIADIFEMDLAKVKRGAPATIKVVAYPDDKFEGTVDWVSSSLDPTTRTAKVRVTVKNPGRKLLPEMFATAQIATEGAKALSVPRRALLHLGEQTVVYVKRGEGAEGKVRFERLPVIVDEDEAGDFVPVKHGLATGDQVVVAGAILLSAS